jgi:D-isomer specific 2-hydroxyacid dehydrogenase, catalytic domain
MCPRFPVRRSAANQNDRDRPVVVALGAVDPTLVNGVLGSGISFLAEPSADDLAVAVGAIARADAVVDKALFEQAPRLRVVARTGVGVDLVDLATTSARGIPVVITPSSGTRAVAEGVLALALHLVKRLGPLTRLVREGHWAERDAVVVGDLDGANMRHYRLRAHWPTHWRTRRGVRYADPGSRFIQPTARGCRLAGSRRPRCGKRRGDVACAVDRADLPPRRQWVSSRHVARVDSRQLWPWCACRPRRRAGRAGISASSLVWVSMSSLPSHRSRIRSSTTRTSCSPLM